MQLFHLVAAWLFPCAVCATTTMTTPAAADDGEGGRVAEPAPTGDRLQLGTSSSRQQRSRSASPPCFGARTRRQTVANDEPTTAEHHPRKSGRRSADEEAAAPPPATMIPRSSPLVGEGRRKGGSAIATEDEIRAFVVANGSRAIPLV
uniref:Uncharacterized protein n=1 Tax=Oryza meridionalis TaxID=40149 RepID=A0A0E0DCI9_9ORYZ